MVLTSPDFQREFTTITSAHVDLPEVSNSYNRSEIKAISSIKINSFIQASSFLFKIDKIMQRSMLKTHHNSFTTLKKKFVHDPIYRSKNLNQIPISQKLKILQERFNRCFDIPIMKKLSAIRILNEERAFLRWKVQADTTMQNRCIKRFAVNARINHAVAIWRLRWLVERDRLDS